MAQSRYRRQSSIRHIPDDLHPQILVHLPVKSLVRFRCVSKLWEAFITDPDFIRSHLTHQNASNNVNNDQIMVVQTEFPSYMERKFPSCIESIVRYNKDFKVKTTLGILETDKLPVDYPKNLLGTCYCGYNKYLLGTCYCGYNKWRVTGSINGLLMLKNRDNDKLLMLWNPSIRKARVLPPQPPTLEEYYVYDIGLGFDPSIKDYKYLRVVRKGDVVHSFLVYTLGTNSWKQNLVPKGCPKASIYMSFASTNSVCFGGVIYFIIRHDTEQSVVASYDLSSEEFSRGNLPEGEASDFDEFDDEDGSYDFDSLTLANDGSSMTLVYLHKTNGWIWYSGEGGSRADHITWSKVHTFDVKIHDYQRRGFDAINFLYLNNNDEMLFVWTSLDLTISVKLVVSFNLKTNKEKVLMKTNRDHYLCDGYSYVESLILINE